MGLLCPKVRNIKTQIENFNFLNLKFFNHENEQHNLFVINPVSMDRD